MYIDQLNSAIVGFGQADVSRLETWKWSFKNDPPHFHQYRNVLVFANNFQMKFLILDHCEIGIYVAWCNRKKPLETCAFTYFRVKSFPMSSTYILNEKHILTILLSVRVSIWHKNSTSNGFVIYSNIGFYVSLIIAFTCPIL